MSKVGKFTPTSVIYNNYYSTLYTSLKQFEVENDIQNDDNLYPYDSTAVQEILRAKPWNQNPNYFKHVKISALALVKMVMHAKSGGNIEIMGLMQGKVVGDTMIVMDAFALPVEGTETRVNAAAEGYEYMVEYVMNSPEIGRLENVLGWYHSHPGYGCWLSGIDVSTQMLNQEHQEPFVAIVIDPLRTMSAGKVDIGAFRTYPKGYVAPEQPSSEYQTIPLDKIDDYGVHAKQYYPMEVSIFKSSTDQLLLDSLWNKYWINSLSGSPLFTNRHHHLKQLSDISQKTKQISNQLASQPRTSHFFQKNKDEDRVNPITKLVQDGTKIKDELTNGVLNEKIKEILFNRPKCCHQLHDKTE